MKSENLHLSQVHPRAGLWGAWRNVQDGFISWRRRARERSELAQLDTWTQRDLGLSDSDIAREASKYSWQA